MRGSVVNVPSNLDLIQGVLPRLPHDSSTIAIYLKRKLEYKSVYLSGFVRPNIVMKALHDLCETPLYKEGGITMNRDWKNVMENATDDIITSKE
jgi:hypothetical protein